MKFSCKTSDFLQALQLVSRAVSGQQALPILHNILFEVEGKHCRVSATDLELSIVTSFPANIENEGSITIPAKAILNFAQYNHDEEVTLEAVDGTQLRCTSKHTKTILSGEVASEYPTIAPIEKEITFSLEVTPLLEALHNVTFSAAKTTLRPVLSGVYIRTEKDKLILVATDSYRLSEHILETKGEQGDISCIVPVKVLDELKSIISGKKGDEDEVESGSSETSVQITLSSQQIEIQVGHTKLLSRLIDGKFPDYQQIIPKDFATNCVFSTKELITTTKRMHYFAKEMNNNLTFNLGSSGVHVATPQTQMGKDEADLVTEVAGDENKIALSSSYLLDFLGHADDDAVEMRVVDSMHPAVFRIPGNEKFLHLIMPLRIQEE